MQHKCEIISNTGVCGGFHKLEIASYAIAETAKPGQFLHVRVDEDNDAMLRRPLSIHDSEGGRISLLYKVLGGGTKMLAGKMPGEKLDVIGPLGRGFSLAGKNAVIVGGGTGVASLLFLARSLINPESSPAKGEGRVGGGGRIPDNEKVASVTALIGGKTRKKVLCEAELIKAGCIVKTATDNGSLGFKGLVTDLLKEHLSENPADMIYACGPMPMLEKTAGLARRFKIPCQVSLEEHMACGVGACMGCVTKTRSGDYPRVCKEGPVFDAGEIW